jgi:hypothetical protein
MQQIKAAPSPDVVVRPATQTRQAAQEPVPPRAADVAPAIAAVPAIPAIPPLPAVAATPPSTAKIWTTAQPAPDPMEQAIRDLLFSDGFQLSLFALVFPFAIALARRVWVRSGPRQVAPNLENSPRLQRIEQAIESIALEVERIGEAQRFTTKVLAEREPAAGRIPSAPTGRRDTPGVITPH